MIPQVQSRQERPRERPQAIRGDDCIPLESDFEAAGDDLGEENSSLWATAVPIISESYYLEEN